MTALTSIPVWWLVGGSLVIALMFSVGVVALLHWRSAPDGRERRGITAAAYMTAVGSLFAILTGFMINSAYVTLQNAQDSVGNEVAAATQLAYASGALPPPDALRIQGALKSYMAALPTGEWQALGQGTPDQSPAVAALRTLQQDIFAVTTRTYVSSATSSALVDNASQLTIARRQWIAISTEDLPFPLFVLAVLSGLALITNALIVSGRSGRRYGLVALGIIVIVALDISAIVGISAPFRGPFVVDSSPITQFTTELQAGQYLPWESLR